MLRSLEASEIFPPDSMSAAIIRLFSNCAFASLRGVIGMERASSLSFLSSRIYLGKSSLWATGPEVKAIAYSV